jgi:hypothetical protein
MVQYLGYIVDEHGVHVYLAKIQVIHDWLASTTLTELQRFLGLANFYRRFMLGFSHIAWALSQVTKGSGRAKLVWGKEQQRAFDDLKHHLCSAPILSLTQGKLQNDRHQKWSTYLQQFHININYKTCISNHVFYCLNRSPVAVLTTVLQSCGHEASEWPQIYQDDLDFPTTYQLLGIGATVTNFHIQDKLLCHLGHLCVPTSERAKMIWESHYSRVARHFSVDKTVAILQKHFYWPKLRQDVSKYIGSCISCAIAKPTIKKQGLYTPLLIPEKSWESISMDYMSGLSSTKNENDCVFVVVDRFSKMAILIACKKSVTAVEISKLFFEQVWVHFGIPQTIISNRDNRFLNNFCSSL